MIKSAASLIDIGPGGGEIVAVGTPEKMVVVKGGIQGSF
jgi:excinuclease UvrABC ATPase subunit